MRLLIDTHILLWAAERPNLITPTLRAAMRDEANEIVISAATIWEPLSGERSGSFAYGISMLGLD